jgi:hypothetical protein
LRSAPAGYRSLAGDPVLAANFGLLSRRLVKVPRERASADQVP